MPDPTQVDLLAVDDKSQEIAPPERRPIYLNSNDYKLDYCNICGNSLKDFYASYSETPNRCGKCHSLERHRILKWAYDWHIRREYSFEGKEILACTPGDAEMFILYGAKKIVTFDVRPVAWFDLQMNISNMDQIPDESFDCFTAISVLPMTRDDVAAIDEIHRVLRPGGRFISQTSNIMNGRTQPFEDTYKYVTEDDKQYDVGTFRVYGDTDYIRLIGRRFTLKTFYGFDPITGNTDFIACGIKE